MAIQHLRTYTAGRVPTSGELVDGQWFINMADGYAFLKDADGEIRTFRPMEVKTFNITSAGQTSFPVLASAKIVLTFMINQIDYSEFTTINPAGSGIIVYNDVAGEYPVEVGDFVKVLYF